jgi:flagellar motor switch protein FliN/FliY
MSDDPAFVADPPSSQRIAPPRGSLPIRRQIPTINGDEKPSINLTVSIELGRVRRKLEEVLQMSAGSVLVLDKQANDPVDIVVNDQLVARGEVVVLENRFAVRICQVMPALAPKGQHA